MVAAQMAAGPHCCCSPCGVDVDVAFVGLLGAVVALVLAMDAAAPKDVVEARVAGRVVVDEASLEAWLLVRECQRRNSPKQ